LAKEKGLDLLLHAYDRVQAQYSGTQLLLVGRGPYREALERQVRKMGLASQVVFAGAIPHEDIRDYYAAADLFVFSSTNETQGLVLIESMATGVPVVAVDAPGSADVLMDGGGVLTNATAQSLAEGILDVLVNEGTRVELAKQAREAVKRFSIPAATYQLVSAYEDALDM
jgi:glycosyltransferase involved in cell wall biosynthesis